MGQTNKFVINRRTIFFSALILIAVFITFGFVFRMNAIIYKDNRLNMFAGKDGEVRLIVLNPGHFHAALVLKDRLNRVCDSVFVYAPEGGELEQFLSSIASYNEREENPTDWKLSVYSKPDFLQKMLAGKKGNVVVLAGNNRDKTECILRSIEAGLNVLSDKPMAINKEGFRLLEKAYALAAKNDVMLYDIMTERYDMLHIVGRMLLNDTALFGRLQAGTVENPAVSMESVHHFYKEVSGKPLVRPAWYYDVEQQGEGIADATTHLIDLIHWTCFPGQPIHYKEDVNVVSTTRWTTGISLDAFKKSTLLNTFPEFLSKYVQDSILNVMANGTIHYQVKGVNAGIRVVWNFEAPANGGDMHRSVFKGTNATLKTIQDQSQDFVKQLFIRKAEAIPGNMFEANLRAAIKNIQRQYPFVSFSPVDDDTFRIEIPMEAREGHEAHFKHVAETFFDYLANRNMPEWEMANTLAKYYVVSEK